MPDIDGKYTLTEIAKELNVVPTFINRVQRETNIGGAIGSKGKIVSFDGRFVRIFRIVKTLRMIGLSFTDIKKLWSIEESLVAETIKLRKLYPANFPLTPDEEEADFPTIRLVVHDGSVCFLNETDLKSMGDKPAKIFKGYPEKLAMLKNYKLEIQKRQKTFNEEWQKMETELYSSLRVNKEE